MQSPRDARAPDNDPTPLTVEFMKTRPRLWKNSAVGLPLQSVTVRENSGVGLSWESTKDGVVVFFSLSSSIPTPSTGSCVILFLLSLSSPTPRTAFSGVSFPGDAEPRTNPAAASTASAPSLALPRHPKSVRETCCRRCTADGHTLVKDVLTGPGSATAILTHDPSAAAKACVQCLDAAYSAGGTLLNRRRTASRVGSGGSRGAKRGGGMPAPSSTALRSRSLGCGAERIARGEMERRGLQRDVAGRGSGQSVPIAERLARMRSQAPRQGLRGGQTRKGEMAGNERPDCAKERWDGASMGKCERDTRTLC